MTIFTRGIYIGFTPAEKEALRNKVILDNAETGFMVALSNEELKDITKTLSRTFEPLEVSLESKQFQLGF